MGELGPWTSNRSKTCIVTKSFTFLQHLSGTANATPTRFCCFGSPIVFSGPVVEHLRGASNLCSFGRVGTATFFCSRDPYWEKYAFSISMCW